MAKIVYEGLPFMIKGLDSLIHLRLDVDLLDATSIAVTLSQGMFGPAGSIVFLLGLSEILEDLTETIDMLIDMGMLDRDEKTLNRIESIEQELYDYARKLEN